MIQRFGLRSVTLAGFCTLVVAAWAISLPIDDWKIAGPFGGTATSIALDPENPKIVLAGARNSLLFQSEDAGVTWTRLNFPERNFGEITSILVDPVDSTHYLAGIIAAHSAGLFESHDTGKTWIPVKDVQDVGVRALAASAGKPSRFVAGTLRGVMLSDDSGKTWKRISDPQNLELQGITAVAIDPQAPDIIYAGTAHLPWRTLDGGKSWDSIHTGIIDDSDVFSIYLDPVLPTNVFLSACSGVYASSSRGDVWRKLLGIPNTSRRTHVVRFERGCCSSTAPGTVFAGTTLGLFKSSDGGTKWKLVNSSQVNAIAIDPSHPNGMYLAMEYDGVGKSEDDGETIRPINNGFVNRDISAVTTSGSKLFAVETQEGETSGIFSSSDRGETWSRMDSRGLAGVHLHALTALPSEDRILLAASPRQMYKSIDAGLTWKAIPVRLIVPPPVSANTAKIAPKRPQRSKSRSRSRSSKPTPPKASIREVTPSEISALYSFKSGIKDLLFAATDLGLLKSNDMGEQWSLAELTGSTAVYALYLPPVADGRMIVRAGGGLYESKDCGDHWSPLFSPVPASRINDIAIPADPESALLMATWGGLYRSPDNATTWYPDSGKLRATTVSSVIYSHAEPSVAYAVEYGQLYESKDFGTSWTALPTALSGLHVKQLWMTGQSSNRIYGITNELGILFRN
ncbi:MAG: hypothetical protein JOY62_04235 [Acidobacteriaceae bacterium]|nr:hypothetical protein [Acidobacteriaceae bacterium]